MDNLTKKDRASAMTCIRMLGTILFFRPSHDAITDPSLDWDDFDYLCEPVLGSVTSHSLRDHDFSHVSQSLCEEFLSNQRRSQEYYIGRIDRAEVKLCLRTMQARKPSAVRYELPIMIYLKIGCNKSFS